MVNKVVAVLILFIKGNGESLKDLELGREVIIVSF